MIAGLYGSGILTSAIDMNYNFSSATIDQTIPLLVSAFKIFVSIIFIVFLSFLVGFIIETANMEIQKVSFNMPLWEDNFARFFTRGVFFIIIFIGYSIPVWLIIKAPDIIAHSTVDLLPYISNNIANFNFKFPVPILIITLLFYLFYMPVVSVIYAEEDSILAAFNIPKVVLRIYSCLPYFLASMVFTILYILIALLICVIISITCFGVLIIPLIIEFIIPIIILNLYSQAYKRS
ncbi:MAG: DUF4013 domain-containing protein [Cyanobacteriota bacterium]